MSVIAGVDVGNATTEVVLVSHAAILAAGRVPTHGRSPFVAVINARGTPAQTHAKILEVVLRKLRLVAKSA